MIIKWLQNAAFAAVLLSAVAASQYYSDKFHVASDFLAPFVIPVPVMRVMDLGMDSAAASYQWLSMIQDFNPLERGQFGSIEAYIAAVNELDPRFSYPYAFATLVLPDLGMVDEGIKVGLDGIRVLPEDWRIQYHLGIIYHIYKKDRTAAAKLFDKVAGLPETPDTIRIFTQAYGTAPNVREQSRAIWRSILEESDDEITRQRATAYLAHYDVVDFLEEAARIYFRRYGKYPHTEDDLVAGGILKALPPNPFGLKFVFDSGHAISRINY